MTCVACGEGAWRERRVSSSLVIRTCTTCGLLTSDIDAADAISYDDFDDAVYEGALGSLRRTQVAGIVRLAQKHGDGRRWLDIGCGPGYLLAEAASAGFEPSGIEPDAKAAALARGRAGVTAIREGLFLAPEPQPFDVISTLDVLEHVPVGSLPAFVQAIRASLTPNGIWIIKLPSAEGMYFRIAHAFRLAGQIDRLWQVGYASPHTIYFTARTLARFLGRHGFDVVTSHSMQELPVPTAFARLTMAGTVPRWQAALAIPAVAAINAVEWIRRKSDALVVIARPR